MVAMDGQDADFTRLKSMSAEVVPAHLNQVAVSTKQDVVKSTAVVKWSATQFPLQFSQLSLNTNLNDAPANWLRSESREEQHLRDLPWQRHHSECSSFAMANCYPDYAGEVDVISDAENIKRLLKIPFENSHASIMVHRVGRTLLLDNFDIHKHLLRQESKNWIWLRQFFENTVMKNEDEMKYVPRQVKTQAALQKQLMFSKFLYHSLQQSTGQAVEVSQVERHHQVSPSPSPSPVVQHFVADHTPAIDKVQFDGDAGFHRQTLWTFEDLRMLIGADLPVFSVGDHPCVSLRLRDTAQPINVVTGLDYWLDNLMCNVPEVAMCYHDNGFVQKYELIKTEDIPKVESCKFDPQTVKDVASNILSFLRNSATKEGHTYWLYKCKRFNLVKLYDLTTLCGNSDPNKGVTPFSIPVAMLLYRVARKLRLKNNYSRHIPEIKALLQTSLQLLDETEHAEVCTSSLYLLSDLYIPDSCLRNVWVDDTPEDTSSEQSSEEEEEDREEGSPSEVSVSVKDLMNPPRGNMHPVRRARLEGITGTPDERCQDGLRCLRRGLSCLERDHQARMLKVERSSSSSIVEEQLTCNASEAIPLKYEPIRQMELATSSNKVLVQRSTMVNDSTMDSWHKLTKALLLRKGCIANYVLATEFLSNKQYGCSLKHIRYAIHCFESMVSLKPNKKSENGLLLMLVLLTSSEVRHHLAMGSSSDEHQRGYNGMSEEDTFILDSAQSILSVPEMAWVYSWTTSRSENLRIALRCLDTIREVARLQSQTSSVKDLMQDVTKKTGAICNELGKISMAQAESLMNNGSTFQDMERLWKHSMGLFERGLEGFHKVKDTKNEAVVLLNIVRLHKIAAQAYIAAMENTNQFSGPQRLHFEEAVECYRKALQCLSTGHKQMRNNILWEFSSTYLTFGMYLQRYPPRSPSSLAKVHQEVAELYRKAIKKCQQITVEAGDDMWCSCKDRLATLEYNLAELHISFYREQRTENRRNKVFAQAEGSFKRAADLFQQAGKNYKILQLQCKRLAFYNSHYSSGEECPQALDTMLALIMDCRHPLLAAAASGFPDNDKEKLNAECRDPNVLLEFLMRPTLIVLKQLLKRATKLKKGEEQLQLKDLYKRSLELQNQLRDGSVEVEEKYKQMSELVAYMQQQYVCGS